MFVCDVLTSAEPTETGESVLLLAGVMSLFAMLFTESADYDEAKFWAAASINDEDRPESVRERLSQKASTKIKASPTEVVPKKEHLQTE